MPTVLLSTLLVRDLGRVAWATHGIRLGQLGQETELKNTHKVGPPQKVNTTFEYIGPEVGDHWA